MTKTTKNFLEDHSGNVAIMFSIVSFLLLMCIGAAVDMSSLMKTKSRLQSMTDQLSLAIGGELSRGLIEFDDIDAYSKNFMGLYDAPEVTVNWQEVNGNLVFTLTENEALFFGGVLGKDRQNVSALASVPLSSDQGLSLALVLDSTQSMSGDKLDALKIHAEEFLDDIGIPDNPSTGQFTSESGIYASIVPFSQYAKISTSYASESWIEVEAPFERYLKYLDRDASTNCRNVWNNEKRETICDEYVYVETTILKEWKGCMPSRMTGCIKRPDLMAGDL